MFSQGTFFSWNIELLKVREEGSLWNCPPAPFLKVEDPGLEALTCTWTHSWPHLRPASGPSPGSESLSWVPQTCTAQSTVLPSWAFQHLWESYDFYTSSPSGPCGWHGPGPRREPGEAFLGRPGRKWLGFCCCKRKMLLTWLHILPSCLCNLGNLQSIAPAEKYVAGSQDSFWCRRDVSISFYPCFLRWRFVGLPTPPLITR